MKIYDGAVLFVDILGISALTTSAKLLVDDHDFKALNPRIKRTGDNQLFCANLLSQFRKNLVGCEARGLKIAQLSDGAFLWSKNESLVVQAAQKLFEKNAETGVFARGGMTYGQIIEPDKTKLSLGRFVCGNAVTRAAHLEGSGKGARVFIDREIGGRQIAGISPRAFDGLPNPSDYRMVDEFLWFSCPKDLESYSDKIARLETLLNLLVKFRSAPSLRWNAASDFGRIHLGATIERLSIAAAKLCLEIDVEPPYFAMQKSELFQEMYQDVQYSVEAHKRILARVGKWWSQSSRSHN